ncbi:hypothetical protein IVG45_08575 [Methylomonas sp. LL1]|uniref:hypothetical protein n=1 Tax=Methylomonas sp. LL1 TaxID=2785785 RepID=UPI0018C3AA3F|nr:hypothetical protein [Methylomonas sp. LL1]QPK64977.1 hypothetical protein IVG45_08575 [Methylomonas sp. LL1]
MAFEEWIIVNHPLWKKPAALVGLRDTHFVGYIPLMDPRDANGDGQVSTGEWLASKLPILGNLSIEAEKGSLMMAIATDSRVLDVQLDAQGKKAILNATLVAVEQAISMIYIKQIAGPAAALALTGTSLTGASYFIAKKGLEQVFKAMIDKAIAPFGQTL